MKGGIFNLVPYCTNYSMLQSQSHYYCHHDVAIAPVTTADCFLPPSPTVLLPFLLHIVSFHVLLLLLLQPTLLLFFISANCYFGFCTRFYHLFCWILLLVSVLCPHLWSQCNCSLHCFYLLFAVLLFSLPIATILSLMCPKN